MITTSKGNGALGNADPSDTWPAPASSLPPESDPQTFSWPPSPARLMVKRARQQFFDLPAQALDHTLVPGKDPADLGHLVAEAAHHLAGAPETIGEPALPPGSEADLRDMGICAEAEGLLRAELTGLGPLEPLLATPGLTDIFVNGPEDVWVEAEGRLRAVAVRFESEAEVRALATRLIVAAGGRLDGAHPATDVQIQGLPGVGSARVHALLPPLSRGGTLLSIRLQPTRQPSLSDLTQRGMMGRDLEQFLRYLVRNRANIAISGGTGTGKTTLLGALLSEAQVEDRLVLVEDTPELHLNHSHTVGLQARQANSEGQGAIGLDELIRQALRMRPTRLVVGECRGAEVMDMLTAMNTGHSGSGTTLHANSAEAVPARLTAMGALAGVEPAALALQAATALDYIIHLDRSASGGRRQVRGVYELVGGPLGLESRPVCTLEQRRQGTYLMWHPGSEAVRAAANLGGPSAGSVCTGEGADA
ncbi:TadA family conjugal transfer-associated ATPase [Rothia nasimurium]|uniref:TadA family conjugal transfer-associated ATPase n=1 Tax=Rothia nasimurium TaxID=85336 RepID=UPI003BA30C2A